MGHIHHDLLVEIAFEFGAGVEAFQFLVHVADAGELVPWLDEGLGDEEDGVIFDDASAEGFFRAFGQSFVDINSLLQRY